MLTFVENTILGVISWFLNGIIGGMLKLAIAFLKMTALNPTAPNSSDVIYRDAMNGYDLLAGLSAALLLLMLTWGFYQLQQYRISGVGIKDDTHALIGRTVYSALVIISGPLIIRIMFHINQVVINTFLTGLNYNIVQPNMGSISGAIVTVGIAAVFSELFVEVVALAVGIFILWGIVVWFSRQFEVVFWVTLWPVSAALAAADPQQKFFQYVKTQVTGLAFTQSAMAFAIWLTLQIVTSFGAQTKGVQALLLYGVMGAGFYFTARVPKYWQELNGHSASGGHEMAALAGGYMVGRFGGQLLGMSRGGQMLHGQMENLRARNQNRLQRDAAKPTFSDRVGSFLDARTAPVADTLQGARDAGGFTGFAASAALGVGRVGRSATVGATDLMTGGSRTKIGRRYVAQRAHTARLKAENRVWQTQADRVGGVADAELNADANAALNRSLALHRAPENAALVREDPEMGGPPRLNGSLLPSTRWQAAAARQASAPPSPDGNPTSAPSADAPFWPLVQAQLGQRASGLTDSIRTLTNSSTIPKFPLRHHNPVFRRAAQASIARQRTLQHAGESIPRAQDYMRGVLGYGSVSEMLHDPGSADSIMRWMDEHTHPLAERGPSTELQDQGVVPGLKRTITRYGTNPLTRRHLGSVEL